MSEIIPSSLGIAGRLTKAFIASSPTPLFILAALAAELVALGALPREEEPQISVPMVDIHVAAPGLKAEDAVKLVTAPLEVIVKGIAGVDHVYSQTRDDAVGRAFGGEPGAPEIMLNVQPGDESRPVLLWDGEWEVTWITFRDMGAAFGIALLGIYILVVAQFGSFKLPLVILTPIPLTFLGIMFGHWLFAAPFPATAMIGFVALAGIIVHNSILLVDSSGVRAVSQSKV